MTAEDFKKQSNSIPSQPGIYKYLDESGTVIYVGKAKNLRKRVSSYFNKKIQGYKTQELVRNIDRIEFTIVNSEQDAFFLENSLIKELQPKYNIDLKDDKTYPYIVVKQEHFPRVYLTRNRRRDKSEYLGPFTSVGRVRELLQFMRQHIPLRTCNLPLTPKNIEKRKFKVCLEYHLGNCKGPCEGLQSEESYLESIETVRQMLKGRLGGVVERYKMEMQGYIDQMEFEKAMVVKKKLEHLEQYSSRSVIISSNLNDLDVFSIIKDDTWAYVNYLMVRNGTIIQTCTLPLQPKLEETTEEVLAFAIAQIRDRFVSDAPEIVAATEPSFLAPGVALTIPKAGEKKKLLDLSEKNVAHYRSEVTRKKLLHVQSKTDDELIDVLQEIQQYLHLPTLPTHIECFDNSNFHGSYPVSAMVCFKNGRPSKDDYRRFHVKTVEGINDFATMKEAVYRRYHRLQKEGQPMPQLVIIDGGKGQLSAALEALGELKEKPNFTIVGLAKQKEELFFPGDQQSVILPYQSPALKLIRSIRDEVHRFGITFHRLKRSKGTFKNELEEIPGIGKATADLLLKHFRSVKQIKNADTEAVAKVVGEHKAQKIKQYFDDSV